MEPQSEETAMNTLGVILAAATLVTANSAALDHSTASRDTVFRTCAPMTSYRALNIARFQRAFVISLRHENPGVAESALRNAMLLKLAQPEADLPDIKDEIDELAVKGATPAIRYKAALVKQVYENPTLFIPLAQTDYHTAEEAFTAVAQRLEQSYLVAR
jgi:hypothetical protein